MEHTDVSAGPSGPVRPPKLALSEGVRASLEAVRVARDAARARARQQTMHARIWFAASVAAIALVAFTLGPRVARRVHHRPRAAMAAHPSPIAPAPVAASVPPAAAEPVVPAASAPAAAPAAETPDRPGADVSPVAAQGKARDTVAPDQGCDAGMIRSAPWRLSPAACIRAFDAAPSARLALAIAHAEHVRGQFSDAAGWALRALALDPKAAEAYVLIARAHARDGHPEDARAAYQRYLELAPRGWHKKEARAALDSTR